jgi:hypothetical protein
LRLWASKGPVTSRALLPAAQATSAALIPTRAEPALVKTFARAYRHQRLLDEGRNASITEMVEAEKLDRGYMGRLLQLTLLAPGPVEAILNGGAI